MRANYLYNDAVRHIIVDEPITGNYQSEPFNIADVERYGVELSWVNLIGDFTIQVSMSGVNYDNLAKDDGTTIIVNAGGTGFQVLDLDVTAFTLLRINYIDISSNGTLNVWARKVNQE